MTTHLLPSRRVASPAPTTAQAPTARVPRWWHELILVGVLYGIYDASRLLPDATFATALRNGRHIESVEHWLHLDPEVALNHALHAVPFLEVVTAYFYASAHYLVTPVVLIWIYRKHPGSYLRARTWLVIATLSALIGFWLFPAAPPRLVPGTGIYDTVAAVHQWGWWSGQTSTPSGLGGLVNEYAAMPSLHVGWALWCGWLIYRHARRTWVRVLGTAYPLMTTYVVISTGNHYFLDAVAGAALISLVGWLTYRWWPRPKTAPAP